LPERAKANGFLAIVDYAAGSKPIRNHADVPRLEKEAGSAVLDEVLDTGCSTCYNQYALEHGFSDHPALRLSMRKDEEIVDSLVKLLHFLGGHQAEYLNALALMGR